MGSTDDLIETLAAALARQRVHSLVEAIFGSTAEYKVLKCLVEAGRPLFMVELARRNGLERSATVSYFKGSRKYEGEIRAALERLMDKSVVVADESRGKRRYALNIINLDGLLLGEVVAPRRARRA